jgi:hypothetical protein
VGNARITQLRVSPRRCSPPCAHGHAFAVPKGMLMEPILRPVTAVRSEPLRVCGSPFNLCCTKPARLPKLRLLAATIAGGWSCLCCQLWRIPLVLVAPRRLPHRVHRWQVMLPKELKDTMYLMKEAISGHQRRSEAIRGDQRRSEEIIGDQRRTEEIGGDGGIPPQASGGVHPRGTPPKTLP